MYEQTKIKTDKGEQEILRTIINAYKDLESPVENVAVQPEQYDQAFELVNQTVEGLLTIAYDLGIQRGKRAFKL